MDMEEAYEQKEELHEPFQLCLSRHPTRMRSHWQDTLELMYFYKTTGCQYTIRNKQYTVQSGDLMVVNPLENHSCSDFGNAEVCCLVLRTELLGAYSGVLIRHQIRQDNILRGIFESLYRIQPWGKYLGIPDSEPTYFHIMSATYGILGRLIEAYVYDETSPEKRLRQVTSSKRVRRMMHYIGAHYAEEISVTQLAALVELSESRTAHIFRDVTGSSIMEYTEHIRMRHAKELLREGDKSITEIALAVGYSEHSYFTHRFRQHTGMTPTEYRKNAREQGYYALGSR